LQLLYFPLLLHRCIHSKKISSQACWPKCIFLRQRRGVKLEHDRSGRGERNF
jgi:hypothetical protein